MGGSAPNSIDGEGDVELTKQVDFRRSVRYVISTQPARDVVYVQSYFAGRHVLGAKSHVSEGLEGSFNLSRDEI